MSGTKIPGEPDGDTPWSDGMDRDSLETVASTEDQSNWSGTNYDQHTVIGWQSHYTVCDRSGFRLQEHEIVSNWDGLTTRPESRDHKHPTEFARHKMEREHRGSHRPEPPMSDLNYIGPYFQRRVRFDPADESIATTVMLNNNPGTATEKLLLSVWLRRRRSGIAESWFENWFSTVADLFRLVFDANDFLRVYMRDTTAGAYLHNADIASQTLTPDDGWTHILLAWEKAGNLTVYFNDTEVIDVASANSNAMGTNNTGGTYGIVVGGTNIASFVDASVDMGDLWVTTGLYLDLSVEANRRKFRDANGRPVRLAPKNTVDGVGPTVYMGGNMRAAQWNNGKNLGSVDGFAMTGEVTDL